MWREAEQKQLLLPRNGGIFYCDRHSHNERRTTFIHPQTGHASPENSAFILQEQARIMSKPGAELSSISDTSTNLTSSSKSLTRSSSKVHSFGKRQQSVKRNPNVPVEVRGWLYKQDSSGMRLWKRKWFVLADFCLFYYKDSREQSVLGSIPLPSYEVSPVGPQDHISRKYAFKASGLHTHLDKRSSLIGPSKRGSLIGPSKRGSLIGSQAEHSGMRTYFFSADTQEDMSTWIRAMNRASRVQNQTGVQTEVQTEVQTHTEVRNGVSRVQNGVHCGTNTAPDRSSDLLDQISVSHKDSTQSSEKTLVHKVLLEPVVHREDLDLDRDQTERRSFKTSSAHLDTPPVATPPANTRTSVSAPVSRAPSQNRFPADFSRNGLVSTPSPILEPNGIAAGTYQKTPPLATPPGSAYRQATPTGDTYRQATPPDSSLNRSSVREQVQNWVKVQKRTPPTQFSPIEPPPEYNPPAGRVGEYRYAQDRLSHFGLSEPGQANPYWRLYEWQQRLQYRHGSPTAPLYNPAPQYPFGPRPLTAADHSRAPTPRCIPVPPSAADVPAPPPSGPTGASRRPHTPAERLTVRPTNERAAGGGPFATSPRRTKSQFFKASTLERRSVPVSGYMTHTVSAPSLHGKTVDDMYLQLKKDLEYLDLKVVGSPQQKEVGRPVKVAESDVDVKLSRLCEQDRILKDLETRISSLKEDKDKLESVLDMSHQQMEQFSDLVSQQKISLQQRLLQEDLVQVRAQISRAYTEMSSAWDEYVLLERSVEQLRSALQQHMDLSSSSQQERQELKRELWRIEDVMAGLSSSKTNYWVSVQSVLNPDRKLVPSVQESVPSTTSLQHSATPQWSEDSAPPRPPLPCFYDDEDSPPEVPPLPREATVIRHTSVRGLKRQSDERRRDREGGLYSNGEWKSDLRSFLSEPELPLNSAGPTDLDQAYTGTDLCGSSSGLTQSSVSAFVTLRRGAAGDRERPKSAFECSSSSSPAPDAQWSSSVRSRGRMSADEQLERLKRHQRALVRDRQRSLGQSEEERPIAEGQSDEGRGQGGTVQSEARLRAGAAREAEPREYELDLSRELSRPDKVQIPDRLDSEPEEVLSPEEQQERQKRAERIRNMLTKSSVQILSPLCVDFSELDSVFQQQQRIMNASQTLALQASLKGRLLKTAKAAAEND